MASRTRPFLMTGAAVASAAAIVAATPALLPTHDLAIGAPSPLRTSTAQVALTAITDITIQGINDAYWFGWGGYVGCGAVVDDQCTFVPEDTYYPGVDSIYLAGASGVLYYLTDNVLESLSPSFDLDNYYFEIGAPSVPYVGSGELFGTSSPIFQAAQAVFYYGVTNVVNSIVVSATQLFPTVDIGPVKVGGGILASLYFYGQTPDYDPDTETGFAYSTNGLSAILAYISTSISDNLPSAAALSGAATAAAAAVEGVVKNVENAFNPTASSSAAAKTGSQTAAAEVKSESTESNEGSSSSEGSSTKDSAAEDSATKDSATEDSATKDSATKDSATEDSSTDAGPSTGVASSAKPASTSAPKTTKPAKPQNPLAKLGKRISDALGGGKKAKTESSSSSESSGTSSSDSDSSGSGGSAK